eukprot:Gregarina_sp_Poly_1__1626@NODE_1413_length_4202_cov_88_073761_g942_i0_p1_GENE_NODE_1413_length_4202_cov_88_073761_g942_i0NODE_1413_length_4202_cov_88_073761_g942_i0_p1_ORF_typecomplete_len1299_score134_94Acyl_transf_3/PF01757_22/7_6e22_NODE_1413_length_4202_cov_88_073761_g942_i02694165
MTAILLLLSFLGIHLPIQAFAVKIPRPPQTANHALTRRLFPASSSAAKQATNQGPIQNGTRRLFQQTNASKGTANHDMDWNDIRCLSHLPVLYSREEAKRPRARARFGQLLFPASQTARKCLLLNSHVIDRYVQPVKFCLLTLNVNPFSYVGEFTQEISVGISAGLCLPQECEARSFERIFGYLCKISECIDLHEERLINICAQLQPVLCGPLDRFKFQHSLSLTCLSASQIPNTEKTWKQEISRLKESLETVQDLVDDVAHPEEILSILKSLVPQPTLRSISSNHTKAQSLRQIDMKPKSQTQYSEKLKPTKWNAEEPLRKFNISTKFIPSVELQDVLQYQRRLGESDEAGSIQEEVTGVLPEFLASDALGETERLASADAWIDTDTLDALLSCGAATLGNFAELFPLSGGFQHLGAWDRCPHVSNKSRLLQKIKAVLGKPETTHKLPGRYCLMRYFSLLGSGHCMASDCSGEKLMRLARLVCRVTSPEGMGAWHSCLDMTNLVPPDLCLMIQLFGCNRHDKALQIYRDGDDYWAILLQVLGMKLKPDNVTNIPWLSTTATYLHRVSRHLQALWNAPHTETLLRQTLSSTNAEIVDFSREHWTPESRSRVDSTLSSENKLSCQAFCDYETLPRSSFGFISSIFILCMLFVFFPSLAIISVAFQAPMKSESPSVPSPSPSLASSNLLSGEAADGSKRLVLYQYPRSPNPSGGDFLRRSPIRRTLASGNGLLNAVCYCFHPGRNWNSYTRTIKNVRNGEFPHLCGMRVLSMVWIIVGHTFTGMVMTGLVSNLKSGLQLLRDFDFQIVVGGTYAVDSFFFFTGFLVATYGGPSLQTVLDSTRPAKTRLAQLMLNAKILVFSIVHRYLRLGGVYFVLLWLWMAGVPHLSSGPMWPAMVEYIRHGFNGGCTKWWWTNVLFINNIVPSFGSGDCMGWSWYLANDFQFFIISTMLLLIRKASCKAFNLLCIFLLFWSWGIGLVTVVQYDLTSALIGACLNSGNNAKVFETVKANEMYYSKPWCRFPPHLIGVLWGVAYRCGWFERQLLRSSPVPPEKAYLLQELSIPAGRGGSSRPVSSLSSARDATGEGSPVPLFPSLDTRTSASDLAAPSPGASSKEESPVFISSAFISWIHMIMFLTMSAIIFVEYGPNNDPYTFWPRWADVAYQVLSRSLWAMCIGWFCVSLSYAIPQNRVRPRLSDGSNESAFLFNPSPILTDPFSNWVFRFLGSSPFIAVASFCYCVYLIHPILQTIYFASSLSSFYESRENGYFDAVGFCLLSFLIAVPFTIFVEISLSKFARTIGL